MSEPKSLDLSGEVKGPMEFLREVNRVLEGLKFEEVECDQPYFLPGTKLPVTTYNFYFKGGGIGDQICYMPALLWIAKNNPWVRGRIFCSTILIELFDNIIQQSDRMDWKVYDLDDFDRVKENGSRTRGPGYKHNGVTNFQLANGTGGHLVDCGWLYFGNEYPPPEGGDLYPVINFDNWADKHDLYHKKYVVFTTGATTPAREVPGAYWNPIVEYVKYRGLSPVFLGVKNVNEIKIRFPDGCDYSAGIDLRDKTTLMEAAWIMKNSAAVVGLDNGLIQLASCTDAPIVAAYNMVHPKQRRPKRVAGLWREIFLTREELACTGCQTFMKNIAPPHDFKRCLYGHLNCINLLFTDHGSKFTRALAELLQ
jgi:hypothetical protein